MLCGITVQIASKQKRTHERNVSDESFCEKQQRVAPVGAVLDENGSYSSLERLNIGTSKIRRILQNRNVCVA